MSLDIRGQVFGDLLAECERPEMKTRLGCVWQCMCLGCGARLFRPAAQLRYAARQGFVSACVECRRQLRQGRAQARREAMWTIYVEQGTFWPGRSAERLAQDVRDDLEKQGHAAPREKSPPEYQATSPEDLEEYESGSETRCFTQAEIGKVFDLCAGRVSQIEKQALAKLRARVRKEFPDLVPEKSIAETRTYRLWWASFQAEAARCFAGEED